MHGGDLVKHPGQEVESDAQAPDVDERERIQQPRAKPAAAALRAWLVAQWQKAP
jgi:hypothetical protein